LASGSPQRSTVGHNFVTNTHTNVTSTSQGQHSEVALADERAVHEALSRTNHLGTFECRKFRHSIFQSHSQLSLSMASSYLEISKTKNYVEANTQLLALDKRLKLRDINLSASKETLKEKCRELAHLNHLIASKYSSYEIAYKHCLRLSSRYELTPPTSAYIEGQVKRLCCPRWWLRRIKDKQRKILESVARDLGQIHRFKSPYSSINTQIEHSKQQVATMTYLENTFLSNGSSQIFSLKDLYEKSVSNPFIRRAELMVRIKGFEMVADQLGHIGNFYTITCPSRMHARLSKTGHKNKKYDGTTPREAQEYLAQSWACARSKLNREGIYIYGFRVAEPNHDGTPHWHLLLFMDNAHSNRVNQVLRHYAMIDSPNEKGAHKSRFKSIPIDKNKGSAAGYIAKYIAKNIDGAHIDEDLDGNDSKQTAKAINSWASCWSIRQFQQIGGPSVSVWRELRRYSELNNPLASGGSDLVAEAAIYAGASDWAAYVMVMGGINVPSKDRPIKILYVQPELFDPDTGELNEQGLTRYGDISEAKVKGLICNGIEYITRPHEWKIIEAPPDEREHAHCARAVGALDLYQ
jgi:hypothetical protein